MFLPLVTSLAFGFAPSDTVWVGVEPNRLINLSSNRQKSWEQQEYWQNFVNDHPTWSARFDPLTGFPLRMWGQGIEVDTSSTSSLKDDVLNVLQEHRLLPFKTSMLSMDSYGYDDHTNRWYVGFSQQVQLQNPIWNDVSTRWEQQVPVWRRGVEARVQNSKLTLLGVDVLIDFDEGVTDSIQPEISALQAISIAQQKISMDAFTWNTAVELLILPLQDTFVDHPKGVDSRLCWEVRWETQEPRGIWVAFVDVETGNVWNIHNEVRFLDGTLYAEHDERTVGDSIVSSPLSQLNLDGANWRTGLEGEYNSDESVGSIDIVLHGRRTHILNQTGDEATFEVTGGEQIWSADDSILPELDQYVFQNRIYDWGEIWAPQVVTAWTRSNVYVNEDDVCNAYFDGELHFYRAGGGCNNTGRIADVSFHEWGHGFHYYNLLSGDYDGSMSEGISDAISFFQTEDNLMAPGFGSNGGHIRDVAPNYRYPEDIVDEVHQDGLIFAGAVWDWWNDLRGELGDEEAYEIVVPVFVSGLRGGPTIPTVFDEFVFADDDNADLSDGTPNECSLIDAFGLHGLGPNGATGLLSLTHDDLDNQPTGAELSISADVFQFAEQCVNAVPEDASVYVSWDDGLSWEESDLRIVGDQIEGQIPAYLDQGIVQYYIEVTDSENNRVSVPPDSTINPFTFYIGDLEEIYCNDFESDDGGFTHSLLSGQEQEGADDWQWGSPEGMGGDPDSAASGDNVWGNDLGGEVNGQQYNGEYQNEKHNQLLSPAFDVDGYDQVVLTYDRWLSVEDGYYDTASITANDEVIWTNHATSENNGEEHHQEQQWQNHALLLDANDPTVQFSWEINSDRGLTMGGWTIDNVCVYGVIEVDENQLVGEEEDKLFAGCSSNPLDSLAWSVLLLGLLGIRRRG